MVNMNSITVKFKETVAENTSTTLIENLGIEVENKNKLGYIDLMVPDNAGLFSSFQALKNANIFESVEINSYGKLHTGPNDPGYSQQYYLYSSSYPSIGWEHDQYPHGWLFEDGSTQPVKVGIIGLGINYYHEDLNINENDFGWDFIQGDAEPYEEDGDGHATAIAGIIAAKTNNDKGIAGVSGGNLAEGSNNTGAIIKSLKVSYKYYDYNHELQTYIDGSKVDDAIIYAADNDMRVINMSFGIDETSAINSAIDYANNKKGCIIVASAGNGGPRPSDKYVAYPASNQYVISVGGINKDWSHYGSYIGAIDLVAPTEDIYTFKFGTYNYRSWNGTSFSAPQVAGVAANLISFNDGNPLNPSTRLTPDDIRNILTQTAINQGDFEHFGHGLLNYNLSLLLLTDSDYKPPQIDMYAPIGGHPTLSWNDVSGNAYDYKIYRANNTEGRFKFHRVATLDDVSGQDSYSWTDYSVGVSRFGTLNYYYRVTATYEGGATESRTSNEKSVTSNTAQKTVADNNEEGNIDFKLSQNYPNPFNPTTMIKFSLPEKTHLKITVFDIMGREVTDLAEDSFESGYHSIKFNASNLSSGIYFCRITSEKFNSTIKMSLLK